MEQVGVYTLVSELGRGGMGVVHRARDAEGREVALKRLESEGISDVSLARFFREAMARIDHPNVVRVLGAGSDSQGRPYVVLELLEGETLERVLARGIATPRLVQLLAQACRGLAAVHAARMVHRDVKPANLFVCDDGLVKVLDLGVAAMIEGRTLHTQTGVIVGTPAYLSPEQARGERAHDPRTDVWAIGVILYEALAGTNPFRRETLLSTLLAVATADPVPLAVAAPTAPRALAAIAMRCLSRKRDERPTAAELAELLETADLSPPPADEVLAPESEAERRAVALVLAEGITDAVQLAREVTRAGGAWTPLLGGRAAGLFGSQVSHGDELARALAAAWAGRSGAARVVVAAGHVLRQGATVVGSAIEEAERVAARGHDGVVVGPGTAALVGDDWAATAIDDSVLQLAPRARVRSTSVPPRARPMFGREAELAQLERALDISVSEVRSVVALVVGPAGIGKSTVVEALLSRAQQRGVTVRLGRGDPRGRGSAFSLLERALADETDLLGSSAPTIPLDALAPTDPSSLRVVGPAELADRVRLELLDRVAAHLEAGPLALVLEDAQWADDASLSLAEELPSLFESCALLVVVTTRPELLDRAEAEPFAGAAERVKVTPSPLRAGDVARLAEAHAGRRLPNTLAAALAEHTGGNPLFVEHVLDAALAEGLPLETRSEWPLPPTVEHAIQASLDHLPSDEKECLKRLAAFGRPALAEELLSIGVDDAAARLSALARRDLVARTAIAGARAYRVRSPVVEDVAYALMPEDVREVVHRRIARTLVRRGSAPPEELGRHAEIAREPDAGAHWARAALVAAGRGDSPRVLAEAARALGLGVPPELLFELHLARAEAARFAGAPEVEEQSIEDALAAARHPGERARARCEEAERLRRGRRIDEALAALDHAIELARSVDDQDTVVRAQVRRAVCLVSRGEPERAREELADLDVRGVAPVLRAAMAEAEGYAIGVRGDHAGRREAFERAAALYTQAGELRRASGAESNAADAANRLGAWAEAERALRACLEKTRRLGNRLTEGYALANLGYALARQGRAEEASITLADAVRLAGVLGDAHLAHAARLYALRAAFARAYGDVRRALPTPVPGEGVSAPTPLATHRVVTLALALAQETAGGDAMAEIGALTIAARSLLASGDVREAWRIAERALAALERAGSVEEGEAELLLTAAIALEANGRVEEAAAMRARGKAHVLEQAARIGDSSARERFLNDIDEHRALVG